MSQKTPHRTRSVKLRLTLNHYKTWSPYTGIVVRITKRAYDCVLKRVLKLSTYRLQIFFVKYEYLRSLELYEDHGIHGKLLKRVRKHMLAILATYMEARLYKDPTYQDLVHFIFRQLQWYQCLMKQEAWTSTDSISKYYDDCFLSINTFLSLICELKN